MEIREFCNQTVDYGPFIATPRSNQLRLTSCKFGHITRGYPRSENLVVSQVVTSSGWQTGDNIGEMGADLTAVDVDGDVYTFAGLRE